jgi:YHS domain-containing protein
VFYQFFKMKKMKKSLCMLTLIALFIGQSLLAQKPIDSKGRVIDATGNVYIDGTKLGTISMDSIVRNANGKPMAFLKPGGILVNSKGRILGRMGKNGETYYNAEGAVVYQLKSNTDSETCDVLDANGKVIGNVHNDYKAMACTLHCFSNGMDAKTHQKRNKISSTTPEYATDLVCDMKVDKSHAYTYKYKGVEYFFDTKDCKEAFKMNPEKFIKKVN